MKMKLTFEQKIENTFVRYARVPFLISLGMLAVFLLVLYLYNSFFQVYLTQKSVEKSMNQIERVVDEGLKIYSDLDNVETLSNQMYSIYYDLSSKVSNTMNIVIFDEENSPLFATQPSLLGNTYSTFNINLIAGQLEHKERIVTTLLNPSQFTSSKYVIADAVKVGRYRIKVLYFIDYVYFNNILASHRGNHLIISDKFNNVIASSSEKFVGSMRKFDSDRTTYSVGGEQYTIDTLVVQDKFNVSILRQANGLSLPVIIAFFVFGITFLLLQRFNRYSAKKIGSEITKSVETLMVGVESMKNGNLLIDIPIYTGDEFDILARDFEDLGYQLKNAITTNERLIESTKNAEIRQLEAQFNPHFLYNSLEVIRYLIHDDPTRAQRLIIAITKLLRYSIKKDGNTVLLKEDIEYIKLYLEVQKIRLMERFNYTIEIDDSVFEFKVPKLILQPLIENCLKHGYKNQTNLNVGVIAYKKEGIVYLHVIDDGSGMPETLVKDLNNTFESDKLESYGIRSVIQRIGLIYGDRGSVRIESDTQGTHVMIVIQEEGNNNE